MMHEPWFIGGNFAEPEARTLACFELHIDDANEPWFMVHGSLALNHAIAS
jgi:hypothetical protein